MPSIYLSPSTQPYNKYPNGGDEQLWMNKLADAMEPYLKANGIDFVRNTPDRGLGAAIAESNDGNYDLHLSLHSNAAPPKLEGELKGPDVYYYQYSPKGKAAAEAITQGLKEIYPEPQLADALPTLTLSEVSKTNAPTVLVELAYHDNPQDEIWITQNIDDIAENLVKSLSGYFGLPFNDV